MLTLQRLGTHLNVAHRVPLLVDVLTVGDHLLNLRALKEVQLQQLGHVLTEVDAVEHTQQLPAHCAAQNDAIEYDSDIQLRAFSLRLSIWGAHL